MGRLRFGTSEDVTCLVDVTAKLPGEGRDLCLAYKTSTTWFGAGVWLTNDGYVLRLKSDATTYYPLPTGAKEGKVEGIPHPLPPYSVPASSWFWATSLWWCLALTAVWLQAAKMRRQKKQAAFTERMKAAPLDMGPPRMALPGDQAIGKLVLPRLVPGELVHHQAYALGWDEAADTASAHEAFFLVLTDRRLMCLSTRVGAFGILYEANHESSIPRSAILDARVEHGNVLVVTSTSGARVAFLVKETKALANQEAFLLNAPRLLSRA